jgi:DNA polymerase-1
MFSEADLQHIPFRRGPFNAKIVIVGEAPGGDEVADEQKRPFIGMSGQLLEKMLREAKLDPSEIYFTNVLRERPEEKEVKDWVKKNPDKYQLYTNILNEELRALPNLQMVVPTGALALSTICNKFSIDNWRGSIIPATLKGIVGKKCIPIIHPAAILREWLYKPATVLDIHRIAEQSTFPEIRRTERKYILRPSFEEVLDKISEYKKSPEPLSIDLETLPRPQRIVSFQLSVSSKEGMAILFQHRDGRNCWSEDQELIIWNSLTDLLHNCGQRIVGQNILTFDLFMLQVYGFNVDKMLKNVYLDTMEGFECLQPQLPRGLDFLTSVYTEEPYYKGEGKEWGTKVGEDEFLTYGCKDVMVVSEIVPQIYKELEEEKLLDFYYARFQGLAHARLKMSRRGLKIDEPKRVQLEKEFTKDIVLEQCKLNVLVGENINVKSSPQMQSLLYDKMHLPKQYSKLGTVCCDENAILALSAKYPSDAFAKIINIRGKRTLFSSNIRARKDSDGRIRCSFGFAETGRFRSFECPLGSGSNLQNWSPPMRVMVVPDKGFVLLEPDLSQAEARVVAWAGHIPYMIEAFRAGTDVHAATASLVFELELSKIGKKSPERQAAKKIVHACLTPDHEVLTPSGWKTIDSIVESDYVMQWDKYKNILSFAVPKHIHKYDYSGDMIAVDGASISVVMTPDHKVPVNVGGGTKVHNVSADSIMQFCSRPHIPVSSSVFAGTSYGLELELAVALQADGSFRNPHEIVFHLKKKRKLQQLSELLVKMELPYRILPDKADGFHLYITNCNYVQLAMELVQFEKKEFSSCILSANSSCHQRFLNALLLWDGSITPDGKRYYYSTNRHNAEFAQTIAHLCNRSSTIRVKKRKQLDTRKPLYTVSFSNRRYSNLRSSGVKYNRSFKYTGAVHCLTMEAGFFLVKHNNIISITGNCDYAVMGPTFTKSYNKDAAGMGYPLIDVKTGTSMLARYNAKVPELKQNYHAWIEEQLKTTKILHNPFGRRMVFHDRVGQDLFRAGYAWYAQSAVGDVANIILAEVAKSLDVLLQVHDSILIQCKEDEIKDIMKLMKSINPVFTVGGMDLQIPMEFKWSAVSWYDMVDIKE